MGLFFGQNKITESGPVVSNIKYGRLYNWYAVSNANFAPEGWHVPTLSDIEETLIFIDPTYNPYTLRTYNGHSNIAGNKLNEANLSYWDDITGFTNEYHFDSRGMGNRHATSPINDGYFWQKGNGDIWINAEEDSANALVMSLSAGYSSADVWAYNKKTGMGVRLVKDDSTLVPSLTDIDGNIYTTVKIGNKVWTNRYWACTKLNNSVAIPNIINVTSWQTLSTGAYSNYNNDLANVFL